MSVRFKTYDEADAFCDPHCFNTTTKNYTICDEQTYIDCKMFPKTIIDLDFLLPVTVVGGAMLLIGVLGNLSVCFVILKHPAMRSDTNIYLFSLAVSDLFILIFGLVPELWRYWHMYPFIFGGFICKFHKFLSATGIWASVLTVVAFSIERYSAICHPLRSHCLGNKRVGTVIFAIWAISTLISVPNLHVFQIRMIPLIRYNGTLKTSLLSRTCSIPRTEFSFYYQMGIFYGIGLFFIPLVILTVVYFKIGLTLRKNREVSRNCGIQNNCAENKRIFKILVAVVLNFFVCGAPYHYSRMVWKEEVTREGLVRRRMMVVFAGIFYFSAAINPILYNAMSTRYRKAFMETLWKRASPASPDGMLMNGTKNNAPPV